MKDISKTCDICKPLNVLMPQIITQVMRVVLLVLLFQFAAPAFLSVATPGMSGVQNKSVCYHTHHNSLVIPLFLKEKEEKEKEGKQEGIKLTPLIDFSIHSLVLTESHEALLNHLPYQFRYDYQPPLFSLFCTFII